MADNRTLKDEVFADQSQSYSDANLVPLKAATDLKTGRLIDYAQIMANNPNHSTLWRNVLNFVNAAEKGGEASNPSVAIDSLKKIVAEGFNENPRWNLDITTSYLSNRGINRYSKINSNAVLDLAPELCFTIGENINSDENEKKRKQTDTLLGNPIINTLSHTPDPILHNRTMAFITTFECRIDEAIKQVEAGYADDVLNYVDDLRSAAPTPQAADEWVNKNSDICIAHGDPKKPAYTIAGEPMTQQLCTAFAYDSASMFIADHTDENGNLSFPKSNAALTVPLPEPKRTAAVTPASMTRGIDASSVETPKVPLPPTRPEGMGRSGS